MLKKVVYLEQEEKRSTLAIVNHHSFLFACRKCMYYYSQWRQTGLTITSANRVGQRILWNKMYQHKDPIYYTFGAGQKNYQCHGTDGLVSLAPLIIHLCTFSFMTLQNIIKNRKKNPAIFEIFLLNTRFKSLFL